MAAFDDFLKAVNFGVGLVGGFGQAAQKERQANQAQQLALLQLMKQPGDRLRMLDADQVDMPRGFLPRMLGTEQPTERETGRSVFSLGKQAFALEPYKAPALNLGGLFPELEGAQTPASAGMAGEAAAPAPISMTPAPQLGPHTPEQAQAIAQQVQRYATANPAVWNDPEIRALLAQIQRTPTSPAGTKARDALVTQLGQTMYARMDKARTAAQAADKEITALENSIAVALRDMPPGAAKVAARARFDEARQRPGLGRLDVLQDVSASITKTRPIPPIERETFDALIAQNIASGQSPETARIRAWTFMQKPKKNTRSVLVDAAGNIQVIEGDVPDLDKIEARQLRGQAGELRAAYRPLARLRKAILTNKAAFGRAAKLKLGATNLGRTLVALGQQLGSNVKPATANDVQAAEALRLLQSPTADISSGQFLLMVATVAQAIANNPQGRISDRDMMVAQEMIAGSTEPEDIFPRLEQAMITIEENYADINGRLGDSQPPIFPGQGRPTARPASQQDSPEQAHRRQVLKEKYQMTDEEINKAWGR